MSNIISCAQYDYFEIACMHHYEIELTLNNGDLVSGVAHNLKTLKEGDARKEILELLLETKKIVFIELINIHKMRAMKDNPNFEEVVLTKI